MWFFDVVERKQESVVNAQNELGFAPKIAGADFISEAGAEKPR
jgi:hypothetical protein